MRKSVGRSMNDQSLKMNHSKQEKSASFAIAFSKHLTQQWDLTPQHQVILEVALQLFQLGIVAVPLCPARLQALVSLFKTQAGKKTEIATDELIWPRAWFPDPQDTISSFVIHDVEGILYLYPRKLFKLESQITLFVSDLFERSKNISHYPETSSLGVSEEAAKRLSTLSHGLKQEQLRALLCSLSLPFSIITGGPGTGKSFTAAKVIEAHQLVQQDLGNFCHVIVAAPTGKAVTELQKRLSEKKNSAQSPNQTIEYTTLHRLLKITPSEESQFRKPFFDASLLLIDECSMIDMEIFALLVAKLHPKTQVVLIGDPDQLPPVGAGDVFASLCQYAKTTNWNGFTSLAESIRFENQILRDIADLCQKQDPALLDLLQSTKCLTPLCEPMGLKRWRVLDMLYWNWRNKTSLFDALTREDALSALKSSICLCSMREGPWGVKAINLFFLEKALASQCRFIPILFTRNDDRLGFQNGSLGVLEVIQDGHFSPKRSKSIPKGTIHYHTASGILTISSEEISSFELCFTTSVHKSQGSEFNHVCLVISPGSEQFGKALLYTAATRAKKTLHFFSLEETLIQTLLFPSGNLSRLHDRLRLKPRTQNEVIADEEIPSLTPDIFVVS